MSQYTLIGLPEEDGLIQYSPSPTVASLCRMSLHEWPGAQSVEPFFTKIREQNQCFLVNVVTYKSANKVASYQCERLHSKTNMHKAKLGADISL